MSNGSTGRTPPAVPIWVTAIADLRSDLRRHAATDEAELRQIRDTQTELAVETGKQSVVLARIDKAIAREEQIEDKRATTDIETRGHIQRKVVTGIIGVLAAIAGAIAHWLAGGI